jgi:hypothetical protein
MYPEHEIEEGQTQLKQEQELMPTDEEIILFRKYKQWKIA